MLFTQPQAAAGAKTWTFDTTGNLAIPGRINYANGVSILANITTGNILAGNITTGNILAGNVTLTGNLVVIGNITTQNYETINRTEYANSIIASGNVSTAKNLYANAYYWYNNNNPVSASWFTQTNLTTYLNGNIAVDFIPGSSSNYALGSPANVWKNTYTTTLYVGGIQLQNNGGNLTVNGNAVSTSVYANSNVAAYLPTYAGNVNAAYHFGNGYYLTGVATGSTYSNSTVTAYLPTDSTITTLYANAATQANLIANLSANITAANSAISTLTSNAATQAGLINTLTSNAASQAADITT